MLDNIKITAPLNDFNSLKKGDSGLVYLGNLELIPVIDNRLHYITKYQTVYRNLLLTVSENEIIISNSLHKFIKGNNYSDLKFTEIIKAIKEIEVITGIKSDRFMIKKLEFALNIETPLPAYRYLEQFSDYKGKEYDKMRAIAFWYGIKFFFTEYCVKIYDKTKLIKLKDKVSIQKNILRFEIQYTRSRKIPIANNLSDLEDPNTLQEIFNDFIRKYENIKCVEEDNLSIITSRERELYFAGKNQNFWKAEIALNVNTSKSKKCKYKKIKNKIVIRDLMFEFVSSMKEKFNYLICN